MQNYYEVLGVSHDATPQVVKIAYEGKLKALAKAGLAEPERKAEERFLEQAHVTLSNPAKKSWYDKQLEEQPETSSSAKNGLWAAVVITLVLVAGGGWYSLERSKERARLRLEEQRLVIEQEKLRAQFEIEKARLEETLQAREQTQGSRGESDQANRAQREAEEVRRREAEEKRRK